MKLHYIAVTGTMGSGKTTAAKLLAKELGLTLLEENFGENAFLPRFYTEMKRWAFHSQTFFLMEKITQMLKTGELLERLKKTKISSVHKIDSRLLTSQRSERGSDRLHGIIQDTPLLQDVFSYAKAQNILGNMDDSEWRLYQKIYRSFAPLLPQPNFILYLKTGVGTVTKRIVKRQRNFEHQVPEGYLELLEMLNERWIKRENNGARVVTIDTEVINFAHNSADMRSFVDIVYKELT